MVIFPCVLARRILRYKIDMENAELAEKILTERLDILSTKACPNTKFVDRVGRPTKRERRQTDRLMGRD